MEGGGKNKMRYNPSKRGRGAYRNPKMQRQRLEFHEQALETDKVNEKDHPAIHHYPAAHEAMDTQSSASLSSSSGFSSSYFTLHPSQRENARRGRSEGNFLHRAVESRVNSPAPPGFLSSSPSSSSPLEDYSTFSSSYPSSSPSPLVDTSEEPVLIDGNANMLTLSPPRSHNPSISRGRGRGRGKSRRRLPRTADTRMTTTTATTMTTAVALPRRPPPTTTTTTTTTTTAAAAATRPGEIVEQPFSQLLPWWKHWETVAVTLANVPLEADTFTLWKAFNKEGNIFSIDLFTDIHGNRDPKGKIRFKPAPHTDFWRANTYIITLPDGQPATIFVRLDNKHQICRIPSPVQYNISFPAEVNIPIVSLDIGVLINETTMLPMRTVGTGLNEQPSLVLDLKRRALFVYFQLPIFNSIYKPTSSADVYQEYRLEIPFFQLIRIFQTRDLVSGCTSHFTFLESPAIYHRRVKNIQSTFVDEASWRDGDTWYRQTHVVHNPQAQATLPISLRKQNPVIDIGRWNAFKIMYPKNSNDKGSLMLACSILRDYNVAIEDTDRFTQCDGAQQKSPPIWRWIDLSESRNKALSSSLDDLIDEDYINLPFSVRYQLEVCLSNGYLSEFTMPREFASKLFELGEKDARKLLEHVATKKKVFHDPMKIFDLKFIRGVTNAKIPPYCCYMRSARITPSTIYYSTPTVDISNRVIRYFIEYADRFLRIRFTDEKLIGRINSTNNNTMNEVFTRVKRTLANGITIGDRHYEFLAFGNSQFREHGAYFFAPLPNLTAANIRAWMGHFNDIRNVAKYAARLGQCFSTTRAVAGCPAQVRKIDDVVRNGYNFSDGVGRISKFLAQMATSELKIRTLTGDVPSAFQFRLGGSKGMLTVSSQAQRQEVHIRNSQEKFAAVHNGLEIIRWSQFSLATLNRQLIIVLSTLGIRDEVFHARLRTMLKSLDEAMTSDPQAIYLLKKYVDPNQMTLTVSQMVLDGFRKSQEPFLTSILRLWRAWHLKYLKEKAKIVVDQGASVLGCMDETGTLKGYLHDAIPSKDASYEEKLAALPEIFLQISRPDKGGKYEVIEGVCILARNPSLHPGDIRVVKAINVPELSHLQDVVVMPQTGDRDVPSMCSGGDLDGDDYLVIWDEELVPDHWFREPMDYASNKARDLDHDVTVDEITSFFVTYMKNDCLPRIAHAHLAWADYLEEGVDNDKCMQLAQLHSDAVDYNKTGNPANMVRTLQPKRWPHFMEKRHKPREQIYHSKKVLGQLYDAVERVDFVPGLELPFDKRILDCDLEVTEDLMEFSRKLKYEYDSAMRRIMAQHEIKTEFEVWSTFVLSHANMSKDYKFHEELGTISVSLREMHRKQCYEKVGGRNFQQLAPLAVAMYRITHEEMAAALSKHRQENPPDERLFHRSAPKMDKLPLISFPWLLPHILGKIALGHYESPEKPTEKSDQNLLEEASPNPDNHDTVAEPVPENQESDVQKVNVTESTQSDPFGLFTGGNHLPDDPSPAVKCPAPGVEKSSGSLDQLMDFGFSKSPQTITAQANMDLGVYSNLLDFENLKPGCDEPAATATTPTPTTAAAAAAAAAAAPKHDLEKTGITENVIEGTETECIEIVEDEGDLEPDPVDKLNALLGF